MHGLYWVSCGTDQYLDNFMTAFKMYGWEHMHKSFTVAFVMNELDGNKLFNNRKAK